MNDYLNKIHSATNNIRGVAYELHSLSGSFQITGNNAMADTLLVLSKELLRYQSEINDAVGENLSIELHRAQENSATIVKTALAAISMTENKERT